MWVKRFIGIGAAACAGVIGTWSCAAPVRNVILCIGDGMGPGQIAAARCYAGAPLDFEPFPYRGVIATLNAEGEVTDSAASATAMATGRKVDNAVLSLAIPGDGRELETVLEYFAGLGKRTGLVTTSYLLDATPAAFGAHAGSRYDQAMIASCYLTRSRPNVLMGGGASELTRDAAVAAGYTVVTDRLSLAALNAGRTFRVCGLFGAGYMPYVSDGLGTLPNLAAMTAKALDVLDGEPDGFFLMVEGGLIDVACHGNDLARCVSETLAFNDAVREVMTWAEGREDTLVLVTADHETGGLTVKEDLGAGVLPAVTWTTGGHTGTPVFLYGWGLNAETVLRATDNTHVAGMIRSRVPEPGEGVNIACDVTNQWMVTRWAVTNGGVYRIEQCESLAVPQWQTCVTLTAAGTRVTCVHSNFTPRAQGFFRMVPVLSSP